MWLILLLVGAKSELFQRGEKYTVLNEESKIKSCPGDLINLWELREMCMYVVVDDREIFSCNCDPSTTDIYPLARRWIAR